MISENIVKTKFIVDTLKHQTDIYYKRELDRFHRYLKSRSGSTEKTLSAPDYTIVASGEDFQVIAYATKQLRFQDMGVRKLYTKPMFSVLAGRVKANLQYGLQEEIKAKICAELEEATKS
ncbi:MAG: hypothetical protein LBO74_16865 [Candidatus Symbiothrix sp.]|jgi:hypothetical protein|nr:hypothetical protein [Candidatus Symbiothrix sp.]